MNKAHLTFFSRRLPGILLLSVIFTSDIPVRAESGSTRTVTLEKHYLNLPVKNGAPKRRMRVAVTGGPTREFEIELAEGAADWWAFMDLASSKGKSAVLSVDAPQNSAGLAAIDQTDEIKGSDNLYDESLRPQFHFSPRRGWNNDPNGLVFYQGEYHMFFQHNPYGWNWGNMHWGHSVSPDLIHWRELPEALFPDEHGTMFSGSAVVDWNNTAGFQTGKEKALICMFTAAGSPFTQGLAYSNDRGRTWTKYEKNPVLPHIAGDNRDPKVIWYAPEKKWVLALYLDKSDYGLFESHDLKEWHQMSGVTIPGTSECPEFFEIPVDGNRKDTRWVFYGGNGRYLIGKFNGNTFTPESGPQTLHYGNGWYASQTFTDIPAADGRRILVPWGQIETRGMPFNQMMGIPVELTLVSSENGLSVHASPIRELKTLRANTKPMKSASLKPGEHPFSSSQGESLDIVAEFRPGEAAEVGFDIHGIPVVYDAVKQTVGCAGQNGPLKPVDGKVRLRLLVDRTSIEIFGNDGRLYMTAAVNVPRNNPAFDVYAKGGATGTALLSVTELKSSWK